MAVLVPALAIAVLASALSAPASDFPADGSNGLPVLAGIEEVTSGVVFSPSGRSVERWSGDDIYLVDPGTWSDRSYQMVASALAALPAEVRSQLGNPALGPLYVAINREGRTLSGAQPYGRAANFYSTNESRNEVVLYPDQTSRTAIHELGHAYNLRHASAGAYAQVYLDPEMKSFLAASGWRVLTPESQLRNIRDHADVHVAYDGPAIWPRLSRDDPLEDFANSFALYFTAPQELKALSPARYVWFAERWG